MAIVYVIGAMFCGCAGIMAQRQRLHHSASKSPWWEIAAILFFLGINKWLDLQARLMVLWRTDAQTTGWYHYRHAAEVVFAVVFTLGVLAALAAGLGKWRWFYTQQPLVLVGIVLLVLFVVIRAVTLTHVAQLLHFDLHDNYWGWVLELLATACFVWSATRVKSRRAHRQAD